MRKLLVTTALAGSVAAGLAAAPAANAATATAETQSYGRAWSKLFSSDGKAYTNGVVKRRGHGVWQVTWRGYDRPGGKKGYAWFRYYKNGQWKSRVAAWDGVTPPRTFTLRGISKLVTYTCWAGSTANCGKRLWLVK
ncbi:hypothetical protein [Nonomuraea longicatena]|uniref:Uncharacterized protein n=1 Tax=Nonomuraea longicatena TaxID=83682 RepID=A0ABN1PEK9_9ACTN